MKHEPEIKVEEVGSIPENEMPMGAKVIEMPSNEQKPMMVKDVLTKDINIIRSLVLPFDMVEQVGFVLAQIKQDLTACVSAIDRAEQNEKAKENAINEYKGVNDNEKADSE